MKLKFLKRFDDKRPKGYAVEVDKIMFSTYHTGHFKVRVVGEWKRPTWLTIAWFIKVPEDYE